MQEATLSFKARAKEALADPTLKIAIDRTTGTAERKRAVAMTQFPQFEAARERGKRIKDHVIANLDHYLLEFERNAIASGAKVHWARTAEEASQIVVALCKQAGAKRVTRVKSMLGEEIGLPHALDEAGIERVETDLAEHIVQLGGDRPSHIVWPSMHRTREQVSEMFKRLHRAPHQEETIEAMVDSARRELRDKFLTADVSISGANFLLADTGATCTVTNEGNAELTTTPPRVHIVTAGIEKLVPSMGHAIAMLRLLVRSATGADVTQYTTFHCGPKQTGDRDGPEEFHIVLVDNGRSRMLGEGMKEMLRCIRCGACMNHCPVYGSIGGHAYGWVYPGPMGSVLTPLIKGMDGTYDLPNACTLNGRCKSVCPVRIPLPDLLREIRHNQFRQDMTPKRQKQALKLWRYVAERPKLYHFAERIGVRILASMANGKGKLRSLPFDPGWTGARDLPAPTGRTFLELWQAKRGDK